MKPERPHNKGFDRQLAEIKSAIAAQGENMKPSIGRIVHVNIGTVEAPIWRAAIVTATFGGDLCNVTIFLDGHNDASERLALPSALDRISATEARGYSRSQGERAGDWRWPPRE